MEIKKRGRPRKVATTESKGTYRITLDLHGDQVYKAEGMTIDEALNNLGLDYTKIKTKGTITLEHDGKTSSKFYYLRPLRRIVANKLRKVQVAKDLAFLLK